MSEIRRSARAVVLDDVGRVLLLHGQVNEKPSAFAWYVPGGRLEVRESFEDAATRELAEELGLVDVDLGPWVWIRHGHRIRRGARFATLARFFLVRTMSFVPDLSGIGSSEAGVDWRWWTLDELDQEPPANLIPARLAALVRSLVEGDIPEHPIDVTDPAEHSPLRSANARPAN